MSDSQYDLVIIGAGPAGSAAAVYAARKRLKTCLLTFDFGGQSIVSSEIQNWVGTPAISGNDLAKAFKEHVSTYAQEYVEIKEGERVKEIEKILEESFIVRTEKGLETNTRAILISTGSNRRKLPVPGAYEFENKGLTYCASCDGPLFADQDVAVIGGGNAAFETAAQLLAYAKSVTLLHHGKCFKADEVTVEKVLSHPNMKGLLHAETIEVLGDKFVTGLKYKDTQTEQETVLSVAGIFVEIGMLPNTEFLGEMVTRDPYGRIEIDPWTQRTTQQGMWAAGDCTNIKYHQNNIAAGDGVRALEDIYLSLRAGK